jgi:hypothetical protein
MTDPNEPSISLDENPGTVPGTGDGHPSGEKDSRQTFMHKAFSFPALLGALLATMIIMGTRANLPDPDTWWHLAVGRMILSTHHWPTHETFSYTAYGDGWIAYEWLGEVLMAFVERLGGLEALQVLLLALSGLLALLVYYYAYLRSRNWKAAFAACFITLSLAMGFFTLRPQILGYLCLLTVLICLEKYRQGNTRVLWIVPLIFLVWVNAHATFIFGLFALGAFWAGGLWNLDGHKQKTNANEKGRRKLLLVTLLCAATFAATPYGTRTASYLLYGAFSQPLNIANVAEWQSIGFGEVWGKEVLVLLFFFFLAVLIYRPRYRLDEFMLLSLTIYLACVHRRFFPFAAIIMAPMLAVLLSRWIPGYSGTSDHYALNALLIGAFLLGVVHFFPSRRDLEKVVADRYPQGSLDYLAKHSHPGHMFNDYLWGGYMIWKDGPRRKVFIDGRTDVYEYAGVFGDYLHMIHVSPETLFLLRKYSINSCLLTRDNPLGTLLNELPNWRRAYEDKTSVLYIRKRNAPGPDSTKPETSLSLHRRPLNRKIAMAHFKLKTAEEQR